MRESMGINSKTNSGNSGQKTEEEIMYEKALKLS
jgi:hypothetical protein